MSYEVIVQLKKEVLDPEARAIHETLGRLGFGGLRSVAVSKRYVLEMDDEAGKGAELADQVARDFLTNPVAETYVIRKL